MCADWVSVDVGVAYYDAGSLIHNGCLSGFNKLKEKPVGVSVPQCDPHHGSLRHSCPGTRKI